VFEENLKKNKNLGALICANKYVL